MSSLLKYRKTIVSLLLLVLGTFTALNIDLSPVTGIVTEVLCPAPAPAPTVASDADVAQ